jgi:hypothetical protein
MVVILVSPRRSALQRPPATAVPVLGWPALAARRHHGGSGQDRGVQPPCTHRPRPDAGRYGPRDGGARPRPHRRGYLSGVRRADIRWKHGARFDAQRTAGAALPLPAICGCAKKKHAGLARLVWAGAAGALPRKLHYDEFAVCCWLAPGTTSGGFSFAGSTSKSIFSSNLPAASSGMLLDDPAAMASIPERARSLIASGALSVVEDTW